MESILEIQNLSKTYPGFKLENINLTIPKGCIMGFVGENGAGKTTTIKLILNEIKRDAGSIKVFGLDNQKKEKEIKEKIGVVLDEGFFYESFTPKEINLVMNQAYRKWDKQLFKQYLDKFQVPYQKKIKELSKGMKMKLSIATALSHKPKLLILDEPTSGLDPIVRNEILDIFMDFIQEEDKSVFLSTHITSDLEKIADYITFINHGSIVLSIPRDELLDNYGIIKCSSQEFEKIDKKDILRYMKNRYYYEVLVNSIKEAKRKYSGMVIDKPSIEEIMLLYIKGEIK